MRDMVHEMFGPNTFCEVTLTSGERLIVMVGLDAPQFVGVWAAESTSQAVDVYSWFKNRLTKGLSAGVTPIWRLGADALRVPSDWLLVVNTIFNQRGSQTSILALAAVVFTSCNDVASVKALLKLREQAAAEVVGYNVSQAAN
jgi:hypothetical protein